MGNADATIEEMEDYLVSWGWEKEAGLAGFDVWRHAKFKDRKYTLIGAYKKMSCIEPSEEHVLTVQKNDPDRARKVNEFFESQGIGLRVKTAEQYGN